MAFHHTPLIPSSVVSDETIRIESYIDRERDRRKKMEVVEILKATLAINDQRFTAE